MRYFVDEAGLILGQVIADEPENPHGWQIVDLELPGAAATCRVTFNDGQATAVIDPSLVAEQTSATNAKQKAAIQAQLEAIDASGVRASRAIAIATASNTTPAAEDLAKLKELEARAVTLRSQLSALGS